MIEHFTELWNTQHPGSDVSKDQRAMSKLKSEVERAKRVLSTEKVARLDIASFHDSKDFSETLTRATFEELNRELFRKTLSTVEAVLKDGGISKGEISDVVLVGGSTRIPMIQEMLALHFGKEKIHKDINPDEAVAQGAAIQAGILAGEGGLELVGLIDINPLSLGIETQGGVMTTFVKRFAVIPTVKRQVFSTTQDNQETVEINVFEGMHILLPNAAHT